MQLAINIVVLAVAFAAVAKPAQCRKVINQLLKELRFVTNGFALGKYAFEQDETAHALDDFNQVSSIAQAELFTRFVIH